LESRPSPSSGNSSKEGTELRIAVTCPYFFPRIGGMENYAFNIARRLHNLCGERVLVFTSRYGSEAIENKFSELNIIWKPSLFRILSTPVNPYWLMDLSKLLKKFETTHVITHTPVPYMSEISWLSARLTGPKFVITYHDDVIKREEFWNHVFRLYYRLIQEKAFESADAIIATSSLMVQRSKFLKRFREKVHIIPPGVDTNIFRPDLPSDFIDKKIGYQDKRYVLFVGQMHSASTHKGVDVLIDAFKDVLEEHKDAHLVLVGDGENRSNYEKLAMNTLPRNSYTFVGNLPASEMPLFYRGAEVTVLPSVTSEGFGMVLLEAGACARPTIGTTVGGIPAAIQHGKTGLLVPPGDSISLAKAISLILSDDKLARQLGNQARKRVVEQFNWDSLARKTYELLLSIQ